MKKLILIFICSLFINLGYAQGTDVLSSEQFCSGTSQLTFNNVFGMPDATPVGCLGSIPNASYFFLEIDQPGDLIFSIDQENLFGTPIDVDFIAWGPFTDLNDANTNISYTDCPTCPNNTANPTFYPYAPDFITDCSFSIQSFETMNILNANQGEIYVVLITNFNGSEGIINFQQVGGTGTTTCASVPVCGSQYLDAGGPTGDYSGNESTTIYPYFTGGTVTLDFTTVDIPDAGDVLTVYNGPNNTFPVLGTVTATGSFTSNTTGNPTGAITCELISDGDANVGAGWLADITCTAPPTCGSNFYDSGGAGGDYSANEFQIYTFYPDTPGDVVTATFSAFDTESCCDDLTVYDGPNATYPLLGSFAGTAIPGPFTSTDPSGALTFVFDSDGSFQGGGWEALLTCSTPLCGSTVYDSGGASGDYANNEAITTTYYPDTAGDIVTATFTAFDTENGSDILNVYDGPDATYPLLGSFSGTTIPGPITATDATGALTFVFTSNGSITSSGWAADITCTTLTCGSTFYDSGGAAGNYQANEFQTYTFFPDNAGDVVTATFSSFNLENFFDDLTVYDGPDATYPLLGIFTGTAIPGPFTSTDPSGALTFVFDSDSSVQLSGWEALLTCNTPTCGTAVYDSGGVGGDYANNESLTTTYFPDTAGDIITATFTAFDTENGTDILNVYDGPDATYPLLGSFSGTTTPGPFTATDVSGALTFVFTSNGATTSSGWAADITCTTITCGSFFYDSGGSSGDYSANELQTTTFFPDNAGDTVTVTFTAFNLELNFDDLAVYDGPDATYPLLGVFTGTTIPGPFTSTDPSGALTFVFDSDGSVQYSGWQAQVTCASICNLVITDTVYPLGADDCNLDYTELASNATGGSGSVTVYNESFDAPTFPAGWTVVDGAASADWIISNTTNALGTANEAMLDWTTGSDISSWFIASPSIDITGYTNLQFSFKHSLNQFLGSNFTIQADTSLDGIVWTSQYLNANPPDLTETQNIDISALDGNTTLYLRFRFTGDTADLFYWAIDDIEITADGTPTPPQVTWSPVAGLYTDAALTTPYTGGFAGTVYAAPNGTATYTATDALSCTDMVTVTHNKKVWNGSDMADGTNWYIAGNWTPSGVPTSANCITIPDPALSNNNSPIADVGYLLGIPLPPFPAFGKNLTVDANGFLEIKSDTFLDIADWVNVDPNGTLVIRDSGSLIQDPTATTNSNVGQISVQRSVSNLNSYDYIYWSTPVSSFDVEQISPITPATFIYKWLPTQAAGGGIGNHGDWYSPNPNEIMALGTGYIVRDLGGATLIPDIPALPAATTEFRGVPNNGTITVPITRGTHLNAAGNYTGDNGVANGTTPQDDNWNLIGNPYPSAISYTTFISANTEIDGTIYLWTHQNAPSAIASPFYENFLYNYSDDYIDNNYTGSNPPGFNGNIASGQAFFVLMQDTGSTSENVTFTNAMRNAGNDNSQFYRQEESSSEDNDTVIERHRIWLDLIDDNNQAMSILVGYIEGATLEKDRLFDGYNFGGEGLNFYSMIADEKMSIQGRPIPFVDTDLVPLGINIPQSGSYTIAINTLDGLFDNSDQNIFIEDTYNNTLHDIRLMPYVFTSESGTFNDRFLLRYTDDTLSINTIEDTEGIVINAPGSAYITVRSEIGIIRSVRVYDIVGRLILNSEQVNEESLTLEDTRLSAGTYIVKAELANGKQKIQKIILKN